MNWFRMHSEFATDPKLKSFPQSQRYWVVVMLCLANASAERGAILLDREDVASAVDATEEEFDVFLSKLIRKNIVSIRDDDAIIFLNWRKRQYANPSDAPDQTAERKRRQRAFHAQKGVDHDIVTSDIADVTSMSRDVTTPCHDIRTEQIQNRTDSEHIPPNPPRGGTGEKQTRSVHPTLAQAREYGSEIEMPTEAVDQWFDHFVSNGWVVGKARTPMKDWQAALRTGKRFWLDREQEKRNGHNGGGYRNGANGRTRPTEPDTDDPMYDPAQPNVGLYPT